MKCQTSVIRMAKVDKSNGYRQVSTPYPKSELIRSTDANFRPVNLKTGPDGALYIVDMYRVSFNGGIGH
jgi:hypothetical protein